MAKTATALQQALRKVKPEQALAPEPAARPASYKAPSRDGKVPINVYLAADYKRSLRLVQAQSGKSLQAIVAEALNDVFTKYRVPTVSEK